jgi:hypothetical protein
VVFDVPLAATVVDAVDAVVWVSASASVSCLVLLVFFFFFFFFLVLVCDKVSVSMAEDAPMVSWLESSSPSSSAVPISNVLLRSCVGASSSSSPPSS